LEPARLPLVPVKPNKPLFMIGDFSSGSRWRGSGYLIDNSDTRSGMRMSPVLLEMPILERSLRSARRTFAWGKIEGGPMYSQFYGFKEKPFNQPGPSFFFASDIIKPRLMLCFTPLANARVIV